MTLKNELMTHMRADRMTEFGSSNGMLVERARGELKTAIGHAQLGRNGLAAKSLASAETFLGRTSAGAVSNQDELARAFSGAQAALTNEAQDAVQAVTLCLDVLKQARVHLESVRRTRETKFHFKLTSSSSTYGADTLAKAIKLARESGTWTEIWPQTPAAERALEKKFQASYLKILGEITQVKRMESVRHREAQDVTKHLDKLDLLGRKVIAAKRELNNAQQVAASMVALGGWADQ